MNEIAIENFINFCDDMMIAEEEFSGKEVLAMMAASAGAVGIKKLSDKVSEKDCIIF